MERRSITHNSQPNLSVNPDRLINILTHPLEKTDANCEEEEHIGQLLRLKLRHSRELPQSQRN